MSKIIDILKLLIKEQSDPKNPDSYPSHDDWTMKDWKTFYESLLKKWADPIKAKKQFLRYWEPITKSFFDEPAEDELDDEEDTASSAFSSPVFSDSSFDLDEPLPLDETFSLL